MKYATFDAVPHGTLYPPVFFNDDMRPEVRAHLVSHIYSIISPVAPNPQDWVRLWVIGSGASYNWSESGDLDVQLWVDPAKVPSIDPRVFLTDVRAALEPYRGMSLEDVGIGGEMTLQLFAKLGAGTKQDNLDQKPYAAYDLDNGTWAVYPEIMSNAWYADRFEDVESKAETVAAEAEKLLAEIAQSQDALHFWRGASDDDPRYDDRVLEYTDRLAAAQEGASKLYDGLVRDRQKAYKPDGEGIDDPRDSLLKVLEMWGVKQRLEKVVKEYRAQKTVKVAAWLHAECGVCHKPVTMQHRNRRKPGVIWEHDDGSTDHEVFNHNVRHITEGDEFSNGALIVMEGAGPTDEELLALITETLVGPYRPRGLLPDAKPMSIIRLTDGQIRVVWTDGVITDARPRTYASRTGNRTHAMPTSWRPYSHDHFWQDHSVVITSEGGGSGRRAYEVFVNGWVIATRPRLDEAKLAAEAHVGKPLAFKQERLEPYEVDHYYWGPTTEFSSPTTIWTADV